MATKTIRMKCPECSGVGHRMSRYGMKACEKCNSTGSVTKVINTRVRKPKPQSPPMLDKPTKMDKAKDIFEWLLGYKDFPQRQDGEGLYWWRKELRKKIVEAGIKSSDGHF